MAQEMAVWLHTLLPEIVPWDGGGAGCWLAVMKLRHAEHNPPFYWLGRAIDTIDDGGHLDILRARLVAAHGAHACESRGEADQHAQDVLSEACAFAWAATRLGPPTFEAARGDLETGAVRIAVAAHRAYVIPRRLRPVDSLQRVMQAVAGHTETAAHLLPPGERGIVYLDVWHQQQYAQNLGYRLDVTEALLDGLRHSAAEHRLGHVLTRPFQWGNPVEATY